MIIGEYFARLTAYHSHEKPLLRTDHHSRGNHGLIQHLALANHLFLVQYLHRSRVANHLEGRLLGRMERPELRPGSEPDHVVGVRI